MKRIYFKEKIVGTLILFLFLSAHFYSAQAQCPGILPVDFFACYDDDLDDFILFEICPDPGQVAGAFVIQGEIEGCCDDLDIYEGAMGSGIGGILLFDDESGDLSGNIYTASAPDLCLTFVIDDSDGSFSCAGNASQDELQVSTTLPPVPVATACYDDGLDDFILFEVCPGPGEVITVLQGEIEGCCDDLDIYEGAMGSGIGGILLFDDESGDLTGNIYSASAPGLCLTFVIDDSDGSFSCAGNATQDELQVALTTLPPPPDQVFCYGDDLDDEVIFEICPEPGCNLAVADICAGTFETCCDNLTVFEGATGSNTTGTILFGPAVGDLSGTNIAATVEGNCLIFVANSDGNFSCAGNATEAALEVYNNSTNCTPPCMEEITFTVTATGCDMTGATIDLIDTAGPTTVATMPLGADGGSGTFGMQACGTYDVVIAGAPLCYTDAGGGVGPTSITTDGIGTEAVSFSLAEPPTSNTDIPTLSQWGVIMLVLLLMTFGSIKIGMTSPALAGAASRNVNLPGGQFRMPFNAAILRKALTLTSILALIGFAICFVIYGAIFVPDLIGVALSGPVFAYLAHLIYLIETGRSK